MSKEIIIGKEGTQSIKITDPYVSRQHAKLVIDNAGKMTITDNGSLNGTFLKMQNGQFKQITSYAVSAGMTLRFGPQFECKVKDLIPAAPPPPPAEKVDISHLKELDELHTNEKIRLEKKSAAIASSRMLVLLSATAVTGIVGLIMSYFFKSDDNDSTTICLKIVVSIMPVLIGFAIVLFLNIKNNKIIDRKNQIELQYKNHYVCPKCFHDLRNKSYRNILLAGKCPACKVEYKGTL